MKNNISQNNTPTEWQRVRLGDVGKAIIGLTYSPKDVVSDGGTLVFRSSNIRGSKIDYDDQVRVVVPISKNLMTREGDILICARNGSRRLIGKNAYIKKEDAGNAFGAFMVVYRTENSEYVHHLFQSYLFRKEIEKDLGPTINQVTTGNLNSFKFWIPIPTEQKRIVSVLETWDQEIEKLTNKIKIKKNIKKGLMQNLLTGKVRLSGFNEKWKTVELGELLDYEQPTKYIVKNTDYNNTHKTPVLTANKAFILGYTSETNGIYKKHPVIIFDDFTTDNKFVDFEFKVKSSAIKILSAKNKDTNLRFVFEKIQLIDFVVGQHKRHYLSEYQYITIDMPKIEEQNVIEKILTTADNEIKMLEKRLSILKDQKKYLLNNLITGTIRTKA
jgi:type I restriction enzyme S subunit